MAVSRANVVDQNFRAHVSALGGRRRDGSLVAEPGAAPGDLGAPIAAGCALTGRKALELFEIQVTSRLLDFVARELKAEGQGYYTIGSSGHEGNAAVASAARPDDPAFLHYRSGPFYLARAAQVPGPAGPFDVLLGIVASADEPMAGGRHKVFGSKGLNIPPQTSTIASHLPKAVGCAVALERRARLEKRREERIAICTFGDASSNHASATTAVNAAAWTAHQRVPCPILFVCEDNGIGISVRTPGGWVASNFRSRAGLHYIAADGLDLLSAWQGASEAVDWVRRHRRPALLHLRTVRLLGHAGSDVEQLYRTREEIEAEEANDPLLRSATLIIEAGLLTSNQVLELYEDTRSRLRALARQAAGRAKLETRAHVMAPLEWELPPETTELAGTARRVAAFGELPELGARPRHLAFQLNRALTDLLLAHDNAILFGEDVAKKGGVYHVTAGLTQRFGVGRVFNTLLDETSILGLAMGAGHAGLFPVPEIQYLAYLMNAIDQLRGEAGSMQFFSQGQFSNPMIVRVAGLAYQKGFGGHFHNDNGIAALLEIPGLLIGCPSRGDDAVRMLRTMTDAAVGRGRVAVLLEPIARYMTRDLYEDGDGLWQTGYPPPGERLLLDEIGVYGEGNDLCIASFGNGLWMSLRVAQRLRGEGIDARVVDLRWLAPLPIDALVEQVRQTGKLLVVDECRRSSGIANAVAADVAERLPGVRIGRCVAADSYIPLGAAAGLVLVSEEDIARCARAVAG